MQRFTISLDDTLADQFDALITTSGYVNRSEAVRDLIRTRLGQAHLQASLASWCVATLNYVYDHHDLVVTSLHTHLDHDDCMETVVLRGPTPAIAAFSELLIALRGVRHGNIHIVPLGQSGHKHTHTHPHPTGESTQQGSSHVHFKPIS